MCPGILLLQQCPDNISGHPQGFHLAVGPFTGYRRGYPDETPEHIIPEQGEYGHRGYPAFLKEAAFLFGEDIDIPGDGVPGCQECTS
jgi:hypothetical protein